MIAQQKLQSTVQTALRHSIIAVSTTIALASAAHASPGIVTSPAGGGGVARCETAELNDHRICILPLNKSLILDLPADAHDVLVSNPGIADIVVRTSRRIYLTGIAVGQTNLFVFDGNGDTIVSLDLQVERDITGLVETLARLIPGSSISVEIINDNLVLWGSVQNAADATRATQLANVFVHGGAATATAGNAAGADNGVNIVVGGDPGNQPTSTIVNLLTIEGEEQVMLRVTVAEIERNTVKQLGIDWNLENLQVGGGMLFSNATTSLFNGNLAAAIVRNVEMPAPGGEPGEMISGQSLFGATVQALEQTGLMRTLAEPTLTAISGESASFLAGGEFPVPVSADANGNVAVEYKPFGVGLAFTPVVLSDGRISLHIEVEVSELTNVGAVQIGGVTLPGLSVRRTETTLEMPSGGALVMSGLIQDQISEVISGLPGIRNLPVIGALFGSRGFERSETELVIIVTPYLVNPVAPSELARPDDGFAPAGDLRANFFGQLNIRYGGQAGTAGYQGNPGFIIQ